MFAGRDGRTRLARPNVQARTGIGESFISSAQLTTSRVGNLTRSIHTLLYVYVCDDHTYLPLSLPFCMESTLYVFLQHGMAFSTLWPRAEF